MAYAVYSATLTAYNDIERGFVIFEKGRKRGSVCWTDTKPWKAYFDGKITMV